MELLESQSVYLTIRMQQTQLPHQKLREMLTLCPKRRKTLQVCEPPMEERVGKRMLATVQVSSRQPNEETLPN